MEATTVRVAFVCEACYEALDNDIGTGEIGGQVFGIDGPGCLR
jgi:hypothetical protein